jgi:hypothetical protein
LQPVHGDICRNDAGGFYCPFLEKGKHCTHAVSGNAPFCEMQETRGGPVVPCRAVKPSEEWLAKKVETSAAAAARKVLQADKQGQKGALPNPLLAHSQPKESKVEAAEKAVEKALLPKFMAHPKKKEKAKEASVEKTEHKLAHQAVKLAVAGAVSEAKEEAKLEQKVSTRRYIITSLVLVILLLHQVSLYARLFPPRNFPLMRVPVAGVLCVYFLACVCVRFVARLGDERARSGSAAGGRQVATRSRQGCSRRQGRGARRWPGRRRGRGAAEAPSRQGGGARGPQAQKSPKAGERREAPGAVPLE